MRKGISSDRQALLRQLPRLLRADASYTLPQVIPVAVNAIQAAFIDNTPRQRRTDSVQLLKLSPGGLIDLQGLGCAAGQACKEQQAGHDAVHLRMLPRLPGSLARMCARPSAGFQDWALSQSM